MPGPMELLVIAMIVVLALIPIVFLVGLFVGLFFIVRVAVRSANREN